MSRFIEVVEVGPRDGLQNEKVALTPAQRVEFIHRLEGAGARRIETVSFVNPARVPQMAGAASAMVGFLQLGVAAAVGIGVGHLLDGTTRPMMTALALVTLADLVLFGALVLKAPKAS